MKDFWKRTLSATIYAILFIGTMYSDRIFGNKTLGVSLFSAFLMFVALGGTFEFFRIVKMQDAKPAKWLGYLLVMLPIALFSVVETVQSSLTEIFRICLLLIMLLVLMFPVSAILQLWKHSDQPFRDAAYSLVPFLYIAIPLALMPGLYYEYNVMLMLLIMVWVNDSAAYMGGSWFGKHKMWARHSPGKTWEGTIIGVVVTLLLAVLLGPVLNYNVAWYHWLVLGFICSVIDTLGDLVESMLKRSVGLKDSGKIMPGHGGFLDRFDSLLIIVPFVFVYLLIFYR